MGSEWARAGARHEGVGQSVGVGVFDEADVHYCDLPAAEVVDVVGGPAAWPFGNEAFSTEVFK